MQLRDAIGNQGRLPGAAGGSECSIDGCHCHHCDAAVVTNQIAIRKKSLSWPRWQRAAGASVYVGSKHAVEGITKAGALEIAKSAATRDKVWPCREPSQPLGPTIAKMAPCRSRPWAIQLPPWTCMGPWMIWPPASFTRAIALSTASTLK